MSALSVLNTPAASASAEVAAKRGKKDVQVNVWLDAALNGNHKRLKALLSRGQNANEKEGMFMPAALHIAARCGHEKCCNVLLDGGAKVDERHLGYGGMTSLHFAIEHGHVNVAKLLIERGANVCAITHRNEDCLELAKRAKTGGKELLELLEAAATEHMRALAIECDNGSGTNSAVVDETDDDEGGADVESEEVSSRSVSEEEGAAQTSAKTSSSSSSSSRRRHRRRRSKGSSGSTQTSATSTSAPMSTSTSTVTTASTAISDSALPAIQCRRIAYADLDFGDADESDVLGRGANSDVLLARLHGKRVAVKRFRARTPAVVEAIRAEASLHARLVHPNVVQVLGVCDDATAPLCIVMEYMAGGSLHSVLHEKRATMAMSERLHIAREVAVAIRHCHSTRPTCIHRDLKSANVLLGAAPRRLAAAAVEDDGADEPTLVVKVADFGAAHTEATLQASDDAGMTVGVGTAEWAAPELLMGDDYTESVDVYSFGILMHEIFTGKVPYRSMKLTPLQLATRVCAGEKLRPKPARPLNTPDEVISIMHRCWAHNASKRPTMNEVLDVLQSALDAQLRKERSAHAADAAATASAAADSATNTTAQGSDGETNCVICYEAPRNGVFDPCGHACACVPCAEKLTKCPVCRSTIAKTIKLFLN